MNLGPLLVGDWFDVEGGGGVVVVGLEVTQELEFDSEDEFDRLQLMLDTFESALNVFIVRGRHEQRRR